VRFAKAHGLGNDFLLVDAVSAPAERDLARWARRLCDRHIGVGADGLVLYTVESGSVSMRLLNADGSDAEISGNGLRCLSALAVERGLVAPDHVVRTVVGPRAVTVTALGSGRCRVTTDLGVPQLSPRGVPVALDGPGPVVDHPLAVLGRTVEITATSLGNPHCAVFVEPAADDETVAQLGSAIENHAFFPHRTNVEFVTVVTRGELRVRFWERGVGYTRASGTGAASAAVAAILKGLAERHVQVVCDGGSLAVEWPEGGRVLQTGEVEILFEGEWTATSS
jgi:diaminopimelate epimerase